MAYFDSETHQLVLQIVYDGAAFSGKTASIESLGRLLKRPVISPEVDDQGRTLLFDWMEYEGGVRFGRPIVCRVLTVPGQPELAHRRVRLIRDADAVVFVADSRPEGFQVSLDQWSDLHELFERWSLHAALTVQLNQRDSDSALPAAEMKRVLTERAGGWSGSFIETTATLDRGTREAFVMTVGEALRHHIVADGQERLAERTRSVDTQPIRTLSPQQLEAVLAGHELWGEVSDSP